MTTHSSNELADQIKASLDARPAGRLRYMRGQGAPAAVAVPLNQDAYDVAIDHVEPDPAQPRKTFDAADLENLAASIRENGLLQPIVVYRVDGSDRYRIIAGERRYRAAMLAGRASVPCLEMAPDFDRALIDQFQLVENIQRADLHPVEAAEAIEAYMAHHGLSQREAARRLGKPLAFIAELLAIRKVNPMLLDREDVSRLPKHVLIEVGRAPASEQTRLIDAALAGAGISEVRDERSNRNPRPRVVYFRERFVVEGQAPIEIRLKKHPAEVSDDELVAALAAVARVVTNRRPR
jgi:ParB/RepB/Spo0J family partition protein